MMTVSASANLADRGQFLSNLKAGRTREVRQEPNVAFLRKRSNFVVLLMVAVQCTCNLNLKTDRGCVACLHVCSSHVRGLCLLHEWPSFAFGCQRENMCGCHVHSSGMLRQPYFSHFLLLFLLFAFSRFFSQSRYIRNCDIFISFSASKGSAVSRSSVLLPSLPHPTLAHSRQCFDGSRAAFFSLCSPDVRWLLELHVFHDADSQSCIEDLCIIDMCASRLLRPTFVLVCLWSTVVVFSPPLPE